MSEQFKKLLLAAAKEDIETVDKAIEAYEKTSGKKMEFKVVKDADQRSLNHYACLYNSEAVAKHLQRKRSALKNEGLDVRDKHGTLAFMYAARRGFYQYLLATNFNNYNFEDFTHKTPIHYCFGAGADSKPSISGICVPKECVDQDNIVRCAEFFIGKQVDINQVDLSKTPPIVYASRNGLEDVVKWYSSQPEKYIPLLQAKLLSPSSISSSLNELLELTKTSEKELYQLLCKPCNLGEKTTGADCAGEINKFPGGFVFESDDEALRAAVNLEFYTIVHYFSSERARVVLTCVKYEENSAGNMKTYETILHCLVRTLFERKNEMLIEDRVQKLAGFIKQSQLDVNATDDRGMSPLHQLCGDTYETEPRTWKSLRVSLVETLIELNAIVDVEDARGRTPLMLAVKSGHLDVIYQLLIAGADPHHKNKWGQTAFKETEDKEILTLLNKKFMASSKEASSKEADIHEDSNQLDRPPAYTAQNEQEESMEISQRIERLETSVEHMSNSMKELTQKVMELTKIDLNVSGTDTA